MSALKTRFRHTALYPWIMGFLACLWLILRTGRNPRRISYPCQKAALPLAMNWLMGVSVLLGVQWFARRWLRVSMAAILAFGILWLVGTIPLGTNADTAQLRSLPTWEVEDPISQVFVMDDLPPTPGSLAPGDASVPDEYLHDPAVDTLVAIMAAEDLFLHRNATQPTGIVGASDVVIIKGNYQWDSWNTTNTDRVKGLVWQILQHPDGFEGHIIVCDNTQDIGTGFNDQDNNSDDPNQSIIDVVNTFSAKGYPVGYLDWNFIWDTVADEYDNGDYADGYIYDPDTKVTYPKFSWWTGEEMLYISLCRGIWDDTAGAYDPDLLCIIDFPVLKAHFWAGATVAIKNWIGVATTAYADERYGDIYALHNLYYFTEFALVARIMCETFPRLSIVDATWTTKEGPINLEAVERTNMLVASTDPVAASWYAAKYILTPIAEHPEQTNPDQDGGTYATVLSNWTQCFQLSGYYCTSDSTEMSVYDRAALIPSGSEGPDPPLPSNDLLRIGSFPNPFTQRVSISVISTLPPLSDLLIYDLDGKLINSLSAAGSFSQRERRFEWDGADAKGQPVGSGVYVCRLAGNEQSGTHRMTLIR
jgi:hypothetical protein